MRKYLGIDPVVLLGTSDSRSHAETQKDLLWEEVAVAVRDSALRKIPETTQLGRTLRRIQLLVDPHTPGSSPHPDDNRHVHDRAPTGEASAPDASTYFGHAPNLAQPEPDRTTSPSSDVTEVVAPLDRVGEQVNETSTIVARDESQGHLVRQASDIPRATPGQDRSSSPRRSPRMHVSTAKTRKNDYDKKSCTARRHMRPLCWPMTPMRAMSPPILKRHDAPPKPRDRIWEASATIGGLSRSAACLPLAWVLNKDILRTVRIQHHGEHNCRLALPRPARNSHEPVTGIRRIRIEVSTDVSSRDLYALPLTGSIFRGVQSRADDVSLKSPMDVYCSAELTDSDMMQLIANTVYEALQKVSILFRAVSSGLCNELTSIRGGQM